MATITKKTVSKKSTGNKLKGKTSTSWKTGKPVVYGSNQGTGIAKPGKPQLPISINVVDGKGAKRVTYAVSDKKGNECKVTAFIRVLGAVGYKWKEADQLLADHGLTGISLNTLISQLHSGRRSTQRFKSNSLKEKAVHHGVAEAEDMKVFAPHAKKAIEYYRKRINSLKSITK